VRSGLESLQCEAGQPGSYRRILAHYSVVVGHAMRGKRVEAINATVALGEIPFERAAQWVQQVRHLYLADCYWLTQKKRAAHRQASKGVTGAFELPLATGFTGIHARWLARIRPEQDSTRSYLMQLLDNATRFDLFDRAEISLAVRLLTELPEQRLKPQLTSEARTFLDQLPPAVAAFFGALDMISKGGTTRRIRFNRAS
jgi:hypothetical protein